MIGKIKQNNLIPRYVKENLSVPSIEFTSANDFFAGTIAISPMILLLIIYYYTQAYGILSIYTLRNYLFLTVDLGIISNLETWKILIGYYFIMAGLPSIDDLKKFAYGLLSPSGFIFITICLIIAAVIYKNGGF
jgi:hypothetical protein